MSKTWTDYPMTGLGDTPGQRAPIREASPISYDGNLYVRAIVAGIVIHLKSGYLYARRGRYGEVPPISRWVLHGLPRTKDGNDS